jgi:TfoX/Sxy family transcriptional regulator of competence genes
MLIPKPSQDDKAKFHGLVPAVRGVEAKPMFGNLGGFVNGNMFMGLFGSAIGVKLSDDDAAALRAIHGAGPFGPVDRPMSSYVALPAKWSVEEAAPWIGKALVFVGAMQPKVKKPKTKR